MISVLLIMKFNAFVISFNFLNLENELAFNQQYFWSIDLRYFIVKPLKIWLKLSTCLAHGEQS